MNIEPNVTENMILKMLTEEEYTIKHQLMIFDIFVSVSTKDDKFYLHFIDTEYNNKPSYLRLSKDENVSKRYYDFFEFDTIEELKDFIQELKEVFEYHTELEELEDDKYWTILDYDSEYKGIEFLETFERGEKPSDEWCELYGTSDIRIMILCGVFGEYKEDFLEYNLFDN